METPKDELQKTVEFWKRQATKFSNIAGATTNNYTEERACVMSDLYSVCASRIESIIAKMD